MTFLSGLTFLAPWGLVALAFVPLVWWLLRVSPPRPRSIEIPTYFLLKYIQSKNKTPAHTPWWILLLRTAIVILLILAFSDPVQNIKNDLPGSASGSVLIVIDNGWASASHWNSRIQKVKEILPQIERSGRAVIFMTTAPSAKDGQLHLTKPLDAQNALSWIENLSPHPWKNDHAGAEALLIERRNTLNVTHAAFLSDGTEMTSTKKLLETLEETGGGLTIFNDKIVNDALILKDTPSKISKNVSFDILRQNSTATSSEKSLTLYSKDGNFLDKKDFSFASGEGKTSVAWEISDQFRNAVDHIAIQNSPMASAIFYTNSRWRQQPAGIISTSSQKQDQNVLNEVYYLQRALEDGAQAEMDTLDNLLQKKLSVLIWPDSVPLTAVERVSLLDWVKNGGFLIRFAGPNLAANTEDVLSPVQLRSGQRSLEGSMTWEKPLKLGEIPESSPLYGLSLPQDTLVTRQVLADPTPESFEKTWLQLEDGTPLITGSKIDSGMIVLIHTSAGTEWSNFCYSGLYVESLLRMISLSTGIADYKAQKTLSPLLVMDGFGHLSPPGNTGIVLPVDPQKEFVPSPQTPPGIYGNSQEFQAFNLGRSLNEIRPLSSIPSNATISTYETKNEKNFKKDLLSLAVILLITDTFLTFYLRGMFSLSMRASFIGLLFFLASPSHAFAATEDIEVTSGIYLAYIETGDASTDTLSYNGLSSLAEAVKRRTTIKVKGVKGVNPANDILYYYPFLYWPMTESASPLSSTAARNLQNYMNTGGLVVFDTRDQQFSTGEPGANQNHSTLGTRKLRQLTQSIQIPELMRVPDKHILTKAFYLLDRFPGRFDGGDVWVEKEPNPHHDNVTSVIIGSNDWAAAWSLDPSDTSRFDISPGGERQREMALRFGINLTMVSLAGNYKADQVHIPYILERIGR